MKILEKDLKQIVWESDIKSLKGKGFLNASNVRIKDLKIGNYGVADMIFVKRHGNGIYLSIYVFKEGKIGISAFLEGVSLIKGVERYIEKRYGGTQEGPIYFYIQTFLVGNDIDTSGSFCYLSGKPWFDVRFVRYTLDINGVSFQELGTYSRSNEGF